MTIQKSTGTGWILGPWALLSLSVACGDAGVEIGSGANGVASPEGPTGGAADLGLQEGPEIADDVTPIAVLGGGTHSLNGVTISAVGLASDGLSEPSDVEFHPEVPGELWVTNRESSSVVIYQNAGQPDQTATWHAGSNHKHFLAKPAALAFGTNGMMATAQQEDQETQPGSPVDFMGPTMWTGDASIFDGGHSSHTDMLHNSPNSSGIAWERDNVYWVYDGYHGSLTRYNFNGDHGLGGTDHRDGEVRRFVDGQLGYLPGVPAHIALDRETGLLYAADPANSAIMVLDTSTGTLGANIAPNYDGSSQRFVDGAELSMLVDGKAVEPELRTPSGLELRDGVLYVSDRDSSTVFAFSLDGERLDWLDTLLPAGSLGGMAFAEDGSLWLVDGVQNTVWQVRAGS